MNIEREVGLITLLQDLSLMGIPSAMLHGQREHLFSIATCQG